MTDDTDLRKHLKAIVPASPGAHDARVLKAADAMLGAPAAPHRHWPLAAAAAVLLALPLAWQLRPVDPIDTLRSAATAEVPAAGATLDAAPGTLHWAPVDGARRYSVVVMDATAQTLWTSAPSTSTRVTLPASVRRTIEQSGQASWRVEIDGRGRPVPLGPFDFTIR